MAIFDFLKKSPKETDTHKLRERIIEALGKQDWKTFEELVRANETLIEETFDEWTVIPEKYRTDQEAVQRFIEAAVAVAQFFESNLNKPQLFASLQGESGPITEWQEALAKSQELMRKCEFEQADEILQDALKAHENRKEEGWTDIGTGMEGYRAAAFGLLGQSQFQRGEIENAKQPILDALNICTNIGDIDGIIAYSMNLFEVGRYEGNLEDAALNADRIAHVFSEAGANNEADFWRKQAKLVRDGEPLNRVAIYVQNTEFEMDELDKLTDLKMDDTGIQLTFKRNRLSLHLSDHYCKQASALCTIGRFSESLPYYEKSSNVDPHNPHPHYLRGLTLLHLKRYEEAITAYELTEQLAPGWFQCRSDLWLARQLASKRYPHEAFVELHHLQDGSDDIRKKIDACKTALNSYGDFAPMVFLMGQFLQESESDEAKEYYLRGVKCAEEPDLKTRLLVALCSTLPPGDERRKYADEAIELNGNLISGAMARLMNLMPAETATS